jgi:hypothetical protein
MTSKKDLIIAVLITFCLTATLFTIIPTRSEPGSSYDPWKDLNDDGVVDSTDLGMLGISWATTGDPTKYVLMTHPPYQVLRIFNNEKITILPKQVVTTMSDWISVGGYHKGIVYFQIDWGSVCAYGPWTLQLDVINAIDNFEWWNRLIWVQHYTYNPGGKWVYNTTIPFEGADAKIVFYVLCDNTEVYVPYILLNMSLYMRD